MNWQRWKWRYWLDVFRRSRLERDLDEEVNSHIAIETERRIRLGESPEQARINSLREIRSLAFVKEAARDVRTGFQSSACLKTCAMPSAYLRGGPGSVLLRF